MVHGTSCNFQREWCMECCNCRCEWCVEQVAISNWNGAWKEFSCNCQWEGVWKKMKARVRLVHETRCNYGWGGVHRTRCNYECDRLMEQGEQWGGLYTEAEWTRSGTVCGTRRKTYYMGVRNTEQQLERLVHRTKRNIVRRCKWNWY